MPCATRQWPSLGAMTASLFGNHFLGCVCPGGVNWCCPGRRITARLCTQHCRERAAAAASSCLGRPLPLDTWGSLQEVNNVLAASAAAAMTKEGARRRRAEAPQLLLTPREMLSRSTGWSAWAGGTVCRGAGRGACMWSCLHVSQACFFPF